MAKKTPLPSTMIYLDTTEDRYRFNVNNGFIMELPPLASGPAHLRGVLEHAGRNTKLKRVIVISSKLLRSHPVTGKLILPVPHDLAVSKAGLKRLQKAQFVFIHTEEGAEGVDVASQLQRYGITKVQVITLI